MSAENSTSLDKKSKKSKAKKEKHENEAMDVTPNASTEASKKRKADVYDTDGQDGLSKKERKKLRKLAKEKAKEEGKDEESKAETEGVEGGEEEKQEKKEKKKEKERRKKEREQRSQEDGSTEQTSKHKKEKRKKHKHEKEQTDVAYAIATTPETSVNPTTETTPVPTENLPSDTEVSSFLAENRITINVPPGEDPVIPILTFDQLSVPAKLRKALLELKFQKPTPIQSCTWGPLLKGRDAIGIAETGSGKTFAFGIPALSKLLGDAKGAFSNSISTLVLAPTRELAMQTYDNINALGRNWDISCVCLYGGVDKESQRKELNSKRKSGAKRVVVGTPGRILDLIDEGHLDLSQVTYLVLDEADRMLDRGFENDIRKIIGYTSQTDRQTVMFSATWPESVRRLASTFQKNPVRVTVGSAELTANGRVEQSVEVFDDPRTKDSRLLKHLQTILPKSAIKASNARIIIFALYKAEAARLTQTLERSGYGVSSLHGDLSQAQRTTALEDFKLGRNRLMVATDVAARGLDIPEVEVVINYTFPLTVEDYVHRIGRTGRAGRTGKSITFFTGEKHETGLAGELAKVLRESGFHCEGLKKFPMTIKKKEHSAYGAFYKDISNLGVGKKIRFD